MQNLSPNQYFSGENGMMHAMESAV